MLDNQQVGYLACGRISSRRQEIDLNLTTHAESMLKERGISREWVMSVITEPMRVEQKNDGTTHYLKPISGREGRVLRVVTVLDSEPLRVITIFFDRREGGRR